MSESRYSSMVRWKASRSFRLTGTAACQHTVASLLATKHLLFRIWPTSSMVSSLPVSFLPKPPSQPHSRMVKHCDLVSAVHDIGPSSLWLTTDSIFRDQA